MNGYEPEQEKEKADGWEADASCTFDLQLKATRKRRQRMEGFDDSIDLDKAA